MSGTDGVRNETDAFAINIKIEDGVARVASCEVMSRHFKHRILFQSVQPLHKVLSARLATALLDALGQADGKMQILSRPDFQISLPGLVLGGLRLMASEIVNGVQNVLVRFKHFVGGLASAFTIDVGFNTPTLTHRERIAVEALVDIIGPSVGIVQATQNFEALADHAGAITKRLDFMRERSDDLAFYLGLLVRYVRDCADAPSRDVQALH